jgi:hypothetical protein
MMALYAALLTGLAALSGVWLQSYLSRKQSFRNRLWDIQRESYGKVLAGMTEADHHMTNLLFSIEEVDPFTPAGPDPAVIKLLDRYGNAASDVRRTMAEVRLLLPSSFVALYDEFAAKIRELDRDPVLTADRARAVLALIETYRAKLERHAREGLGSYSG